MRSISEFPVCRLLRAVNDFDLPRQIRYSRVHPRILNAVKSLDSFLSTFINASFSLSRGFDNVMFYLYLSYLLGILFCVSIAYLTWYFAISAIIVVSVLFCATTLLRSRKWRKLVVYYSGRNNSYVMSTAENNDQTEDSRWNDSLFKQPSKALNIEKRSFNSDGKRSNRYVDLFVNGDRESILYSDGDYQSRDAKPEGEISEKNNLFSSRNSVEIVANSSREMILDSDRIDSGNYLRKEGNKDKTTLPSPSENNNDRSIEIVNSSSLETILIAADGRSIALKRNKPKLAPIASRPSEIKNKQHSVEILNSSAAETIYYSDNLESQSIASVRKAKPRYYKSERQKEKRHLVEIMMDSSIEQIITTSDVRSNKAQFRLSSEHAISESNIAAESESNHEQSEGNVGISETSAEAAIEEWEGEDQDCGLHTEVFFAEDDDYQRSVQDIGDDTNINTLIEMEHPHDDVELIPAHHIINRDDSEDLCEVNIDGNSVRLGSEMEVNLTEVEWMLAQSSNEAPINIPVGVEKDTNQLLSLSKYGSRNSDDIIPYESHNTVTLNAAAITSSSLNGNTCKASEVDALSNRNSGEDQVFTEDILNKMDSVELAKLQSLGRTAHSSREMSTFARTKKTNNTAKRSSILALILGPGMRAHLLMASAAAFAFGPEQSTTAPAPTVPLNRSRGGPGANFNIGERFEFSFN